MSDLDIRYSHNGIIPTRVELDGEDITSTVEAITIHLRAGDVGRVHVDLINSDMNVDIEGATVSIRPEDE